MTVLRQAASPTRCDQRVRRGGVARPDAGSLQRHEVVASGARTPAAGCRCRPPRSRQAPPTRCSSPARESASGRPLMVAGPQVALLQPADPDGAGRPRAGGGRAARGSTRAAPRSSASTSTSSSAAAATTRGARPRPGRTSSTRSRSTCASRTARRRPCDSMHYRFRGACLPIEVLERSNRWMPTPADETPPGSRRCAPSARRWAWSPAAARSRGKPVAFAQPALDVLPRGRLGRRLHGLQRPGGRARRATFQRAASKIGYTFNWFYADSESIAYFNSGDEPGARGAASSHDFPVRGRRGTSGAAGTRTSWTRALHAVRARTRA